MSKKKQQPRLLGLKLPQAPRNST